MRAVVVRAALAGLVLVSGTVLGGCSGSASSACPQGLVDDLREFAGNSMGNVETGIASVDEVQPAGLRKFLDGGCAIAVNGTVENDGATATVENLYAFAVEPVDPDEIATLLEAAGYSGGDGTWSMGNLAQAGATTGQAWAVQAQPVQDAAASGSQIDVAGRLPEATYTFVISHMAIGQE